MISCGDESDNAALFLGWAAADYWIVSLSHFSFNVRHNSQMLENKRSVFLLSFFISFILLHVFVLLLHSALFSSDMTCSHGDKISTQSEKKHFPSLIFILEIINVSGEIKKPQPYTMDLP